MKYVMGMTILACLLAGCAHTRGPEERTDDGLVRVPSRASGGVYRAPGADFTPYKRVILEPPTVEFVKDWRKQHKEVTDAEIARLLAEVVKLFREEFTRIVIEEGPYEFAEEPGPDVLLLVPRIVDLDIPAPKAGSTSGVKQYTPGPVKMEVVGELRDASSNQLVGRVIIFEGQERYGMFQLQLANRTTNAHEMRIGFAKWSRMALEALNVAKVAKPTEGP
jgi:Protein of unknown function (DUF3313)